MVMRPFLRHSDGDQIVYAESLRLCPEFSNGVKLYHAGDTTSSAICHHPDLYAHQIAMLPIGTVSLCSPTRIRLRCKLLQPEIVIPITLDAFRCDDRRRELQKLVRREVLERNGADDFLDQRWEKKNRKEE